MHFNLFKSFKFILNTNYVPVNKLIINKSIHLLKVQRLYQATGVSKKLQLAKSAHATCSKQNFHKEYFLKHTDQKHTQYSKKFSKTKPVLLTQTQLVTLHSTSALESQSGQPASHSVPTLSTPALTTRHLY